MGLLAHMWERVRIYVRKMGGVILVASIVLWILGAFPRHQEAEAWATQIARLSARGAPPAEIAALEEEQASLAVQYSLVGRIGRGLEPLLRPLGFDWRMGVGLLSGFVAKEVVVSTMGVLYQVGSEGGERGQALRKALAERGGLTPLVAFAFMVFVLLYTPCVATIAAVRRELGTRWMWFDVAYQLILAYIAAFLIYQVGRLLGWG